MNDNNKKFSVQCDDQILGKRTVTATQDTWRRPLIVVTTENGQEIVFTRREFGAVVNRMLRAGVVNIVGDDSPYDRGYDFSEEDIYHGYYKKGGD